MTAPETVLIRVGSHRARRKMFDLIGRDVCRAFFSWERHCAGGFYRIPERDLQRVLSITGITKARDRGDMHRCLDL
jgi:hypothetical protein